MEADRWRGAATDPSVHARFVLDPVTEGSTNGAMHLSRYQWVCDHTDLAGATVVDLGCGTGFGARMLAARGARVIGVDLDPAISALAADPGLAGAEFVVADMTAPGLPERLGGVRADVVVCMEAIEHVEDPFALVDHAADLTADDGVFVVSTPNRTVSYERGWNRMLVDPSHVMEFTLETLTRVLGSAFDEVEVLFQGAPWAWDDWTPPATDDDTVDPEPRSWGLRCKIALAGWIPPRLFRLVSASERRRLDPSLPRAEPFRSAADVWFVPAAEQPELRHEGSMLFAVCRRPRRGRS